MENKSLYSDTLPESVMKEAIKISWDHTIGFIRLGCENNQETADLLGSGVLVTANEQHAILTAHHVLEILPKKGRLGLVLSDKLEKTTIDINGIIDYVKIDPGNIDKDGPDLGFLKLSPNIASIIGAKKSFYNLNRQKQLFLNNLPEDLNEIWDAQGFVEQLTSTKIDSNRNKVIKTFCQYGAFGGIEEYEIRGKFDYYNFPITVTENSVPHNFGGMSGGGLWQFMLDKNKDGDFRVMHTLLRGIVYFQDKFDEHGKSNLRCHAYRSIYQYAYEAISN